MWPINKIELCIAVSKSFSIVLYAENANSQNILPFFKSLIDSETCLCKTLVLNQLKKYFLLIIKLHPQGSEVL